MLFNSYSFMIFFPVVLLIYFVIPKKIRYIWLLVASYYFYMSWNAKYALLIATSTVITYASGLALDACNKKAASVNAKKGIVFASVFINLAILFFFKYFDFAVNSINKVLNHFHIALIQNNFDIILPVGISFYTFQALSYTIDVYRGNTKVEKNPLRYALFVSFFPQLVAGPIERSDHLLSQLQNIEKIKLFNYKRVTEGATIMLWGYFLKMVIADRAALFVDTVYNEWFMFGSIELVLATILFAIQIYCDFCSYSLIALGAAKIMGFDLMRNFETPYFATSIKDFWRRWHISLSTWFRDYVYIPLGGSRCSKKRHYVNLLITFGVSGLWHGASWHYVAWGLVHGIMQVIGDLVKPLRKRFEIFYDKTKGLGYQLTEILITDILVCFAWIFFRADSLKSACGIIVNIFTKLNAWVLYDKTLYNYGLDTTEWHVLIVALVVLLLVDLVQYKTGKLLADAISDQVIWFRWIIIIGLIAFVFIYGVYGDLYKASDFIYFQF